MLRLTEKELGRLRWLDIETEMLQAELKDLESSPLYRSPLITGGSKSQNLNDKMAEYLEALEDLKCTINANLIKIFHERNELERYIGGIKDSEIRDIARLRCTRGLTWYSIAKELNYEYESTPRKKYKKILKLAEKTD